MNPEIDLYAEDADGQLLAEELTETMALATWTTVASGSSASCPSSASTLSTASSLS